MDKLDDAILRGFVSGRLIPDATDRLAIEAEITALEAELSKLTGRPLLARLQRGLITAKQQRHSLLTSAAMVAREHVRASPIKAAIYKQEHALRAQEAAPVPAPPPKAAPPSKPLHPDALLWMDQRIQAAAELQTARRPRGSDVDEWRARVARKRDRCMADDD